MQIDVLSKNDCIERMVRLDHFESDGYVSLSTRGHSVLFDHLERTGFYAKLVFASCKSCNAALVKFRSHMTYMYNKVKCTGYFYLNLNLNSLGAKSFCFHFNINTCKEMFFHNFLIKFSSS